MSAKEKIKTDLKRLSGTGANLVNAMNVEQFPERMELHFREVLKKDYSEFVRSLPIFHHVYQSWYSEARIVIQRFLPGRLADFCSLYETPKSRKEIRPDNYVIEDYLRDTTITAGFDKKIVASPSDAIPAMQQQLNIINSVIATLESSLTTSMELLQAELLDAELRSAHELAKNQFLRSAGAIGGMVLQKHLDQLRKKNELKLSKKIPTINDLNELFKRYEVYGFATYRSIQYLAEIHHLCLRNKKEAPTYEIIYGFLSGVDKIIKTAF